MAVGALEPEFYGEFIEGLGLNTKDIEQFDKFENNRETISKVFKEKTQEEWCKVIQLSLNYL